MDLAMSTRSLPWDTRSTATSTYPPTTPNLDEDEFGNTDRRHSRSNMRRCFPLRADQFPSVDISRLQALELRQQCEWMLDQLLQRNESVWRTKHGLFDGDRAAWTLHYSKHHLQVYRRKKEQHSDSRAALRHFVAQGTIAGVTLRDIEYSLACTTTEHERSVKSNILGAAFLDAAVLRVFERPRADDPFHFFGLKWLACASPADRFVSPRDYGVVEFAKTAVTRTGERVLVRVVDTVRPDIISPLALPDNDGAVVRGAMSCVYLYRYEPRFKAVEVFAQGYLDPNGGTCSATAASWMGKAFLTQFSGSIARLEHAADAKQLIAETRVLGREAFLLRIIEAQKAPRVCASCFRNMGSGTSLSRSRGLNMVGLGLLRRHPAYCRSCGHLVCARCFILVTLFLPWHERRDAAHPSAVIREKFCLRCLCAVRAARNAVPSRDEDAKRMRPQPLLLPHRSVPCQCQALSTPRVEMEMAMAQAHPHRTWPEMAFHSESGGGQDGGSVRQMDTIRQMDAIRQVDRKVVDGQSDPQSDCNRQRAVLSASASARIGTTPGSAVPRQRDTFNVMAASSMSNVTTTSTASTSANASVAGAPCAFGSMQDMVSRNLAEQEDLLHRLQSLRIERRAHKSKHPRSHSVPQTPAAQAQQESPSPLQSTSAWTPIATPVAPPPDDVASTHSQTFSQSSSSDDDPMWPVSSILKRSARREQEPETEIETEREMQL